MSSDTDSSSSLPITSFLLRLIKSDNLEFVQTLVSKHGPNVCFIDKLKAFHEIFHHSPSLFSICSYYNASKCMKFLFTHEVSIRHSDQRGRQCFHFAAAGNKVEALIQIRDALFPTDSPPDSFLFHPDSTSRTILHFAAQYDCVDIFRYVFVHVRSAELFDLDLGRGTPFHAACFYRSIKCFTFLAELNLTKMMENPIANTLKNLPIDFNRSVGNRSPIYLLLMKNAYELIPIAVRAGLDLNSPMGNGWPVLFYAIRNHSERFVEVLCKCGAKVNWTCDMGWTAFHIAAQERCVRICQMLFENGGNPNCFTKFGQSPFLLARTLHAGDIEKQTARIIREFVCHFLAMLVMRKCAIGILRQEMEV
jgi:ankyrin repeat protein